MINEKIEAKIESSNKIEANKAAQKFEKKENKKNADAKIEAKQESNAKIEAKQELKNCIIAENLKIANSDLLFSKAKKEMIANAFQMKEDCDYFFSINEAEKRIYFRLKQEADKIEANSFLCFYRKRLASFYLKHEAKRKIEDCLKIKINEASYKIQFSKNENENFIQIL